MIFSRADLSPWQRFPARLMSLFGNHTPMWDYIAPLLGFLDSHKGEMVAVHAGDMKHTAADIESTMGNVVVWWRKVDCVKRTLLAANLVEDNGSKGATAKWRITPHGSALLKLLLTGDVDAEEWWHRNGPNDKRQELG